MKITNWNMALGHVLWVALIATPGSLLAGYLLAYWFGATGWGRWAVSLLLGLPIPCILFRAVWHMDLWIRLGPNLEVRTFGQKVHYEWKDVQAVKFSEHHSDIAVGSTGASVPVSHDLVEFVVPDSTVRIKISDDDRRNLLRHAKTHGWEPLLNVTLPEETEPLPDDRPETALSADGRSVIPPGEEEPRANAGR